MASPGRGNRLVVAAIDIGTTFSGYAFSFRSDFDTDPKQIYTNDWSSDGATSPTLKAPSVVLLNTDRSFNSFGYRATKEFADLTDDPETSKKYYFFKNFKMDLYHQRITLDMVLKDEDGKEAPAMTVFSGTIKYLKDHLLSSFKNRLGSFGISDIFFVITVPAIWPDAAKQFMRNASEQAGITSDQMILAYEPESAALYCSVLSEDQGIAKYFQVNRKLMVVDLGGGTTDITVFKVVKKEKHLTYLEHVYKVNGGAFGGNNVNKKFEDFLQEILGESVLKEFKTKHHYPYEEIMNDFEIQKKTVGSNTKKTKIRLKLSGELTEMLTKDLKEKLQNKYDGKVQLIYDKLVFDSSFFSDFFTHCLWEIKKQIDDILYAKGQAFVSAIILVGGFSESSLISDNIKKAYPAIKDIVTPFGASLAVLKGAVIYGHNPSIITGRICQETIGIALHRPFIPEIHSKEKTFRVGDQLRVDDCFEKIFSINEFVHLGQIHSVRVKDIFTDPEKTSRRKSPKTIEIYCTKSQDPRYVSDEGCFLKGKIKVYPPMGEWPDIVEGIIEVEAGGTEFLVRYKDSLSNKVSEGRIDFL